jgi:hypothetical protein
MLACDRPQQRKTNSAPLATPAHRSQQLHSRANLPGIAAYSLLPPQHRLTKAPSIVELPAPSAVGLPAYLLPDTGGFYV